MRYASRKFIAAVLALASAHWSLFEGLIQASDYRAIVLGIVAAYIAGNVAQKAVQNQTPSGGAS